MPADSGIVIEPLDVENYMTWSARMRFLLQKKGLWDETQSIVQMSATNNEKAVAEIGLHVKDHHLPLVAGCT
eukprot:242674-Chlamydomonas_euryale.AAC.1